MLIVLVVAAETRAPLAGVRVFASRAPPASSSATHVPGTLGSLEVSPLTSDEGRVEFELPSGVVLHLQAWGSNSVGRTTREIEALAPGERRELTLELPTSPDIVYFGRVLAQEDRRPVPGASVQVVRGERSFYSLGDQQWAEHSREAQLPARLTGPDGSFELLLQSWRDGDLVIEAPGFATVFVEPGKDNDAPEKARIVLLARAAALRVRLLETTGAAVTNGEVRLWTEAYLLGRSNVSGVYLPSVPDPQWRGRTDPSGLCELRGLPPSVPLHVEIQRNGHGSKRDLPALSLNPEETREVEWRLGSGCQIDGFVLDQKGEAVGGCPIWLKRAEVDLPTFFEAHDDDEVAMKTRTATNGRFEFRDVSPGTWWLGPAAQRSNGEAPDPEGIAPAAELVEVTEGLFRKEVTLRVHRGLYIRGRVLDPAGEPAGGSYVWARGEAAAWGLSTNVAVEDGAFALGPLVPGRYTMVAHGWPEHADSEPVETSAEAEDVVLRLQRGGRLSGTVRDGTTGQASAASLTFSRPGEAAQWGMTETQDGRFRLEGLLPGTYDLCARASGKRIGLLGGLVIPPGGETGDLEVILAHGALLRLKYTGNRGYLQYRVVKDGVIVAGDGIPAGGTSETVVPAGLIVVESSWDGERRAQQPVELAVGEEREIQLGGS